MALKSTIFRLTLNVSDMDRGYYGEHSLTVARHPSVLIPPSRQAPRVGVLPPVRVDDLPHGGLPGLIVLHRVDGYAIRVLLLVAELRDGIRVHPFLSGALLDGVLRQYLVGVDEAHGVEVLLLTDFERVEDFIVILRQDDMPAQEPLRGGLLVLRRTSGFDLLPQLLDLGDGVGALLWRQVRPVFLERGIHLVLALRADLPILLPNVRPSPRVLDAAQHIGYSDFGGSA